MYCGNTIANDFGGLLAAGVLDRLDGNRGLAGWRWLYVIEGGGTMLAGLLAYWPLPDVPRFDVGAGAKYELDCSDVDSIVKTLGFGTTPTLLITAPVYFFGFFAAMGNSPIAAQTNWRSPLIVWPLIIDIVDNVMVISSPSTAVRYTGMFLMCAGSYFAFNIVQAWVASTVPRTRTKRVIALCTGKHFRQLVQYIWVILLSRF
ncbi:hypothetical protein AC578_7271 [Pseudocercospora eumusae]|uniref:Major facilitator superfamily (MFS) profile domain-containing protein n=1 Tax=Pseudocercospora eumusae TaxID=321146 RepID=A0A139HWX5_9PEZI|nr:hypothetical protein AC578_7271 [Pseudocercospora eumusae]